MTRAGEKLYRDDAAPPHPGWKYTVGALVTLSTLYGLVPIVHWLAAAARWIANFVAGGQLS